MSRDKRERARLAQADPERATVTALLRALEAGEDLPGALVAIEAWRAAQVARKERGGA